MLALLFSKVGYMRLLGSIPNPLNPSLLSGIFKPLRVCIALAGRVRAGGVFTESKHIVFRFYWVFSSEQVRITSHLLPNNPQNQKKKRGISTAPADAHSSSFGSSPLCNNSIGVSFASI